MEGMPMFNMVKFANTLLAGLQSDEWTCGDCDDIGCGQIEHRGKGNVPVCCRCWERGTGEVCEHPL